MASFSRDPSDLSRLDLRLLKDGAVTLYFRAPVLEADVTWLREHAYAVKEFDCREWSDEEAMHRALAKAFSFPDYYGMNLDALNDCLSEVEVPADGGLAIVFSRFDAFVSRCRKEVAHGLLDLLADHSRQVLLFGYRLVVLVQSDDPRIAFEPVGATPVRWNTSEWLDKNRGL